MFIFLYLTYRPERLLQVLWVTEKSYLRDFGYFSYLIQLSSLFTVNSVLILILLITLSHHHKSHNASYIFSITTLQLVLPFCSMRFGKIGRKILPTARNDFHSRDVMFFIKINKFIFHAILKTHKFRNKISNSTMLFHFWSAFLSQYWNNHFLP